MWLLKCTKELYKLLNKPPIIKSRCPQLIVMETQTRDIFGEQKGITGPIYVTTSNTNYIMTCCKIEALKFKNSQSVSVYK
jgi:hypothetical protein